MCTVGAAACVHTPAEDICPSAGDGDLVVTEIRKSDDPFGTWIEIKNATGADLDLEGSIVRMLSIDGATDVDLLVRRPVPVAGGDYVVLGAFVDEDRPDHVDYGFGADFSDELPGNGALSIGACSVEVDRVVYDELPATGTWSLDDDGTWCAGTDTGSPGSGNPPCV
jgi:hypothetical protein